MEYQLSSHLSSRLSSILSSRLSNRLQEAASHSLVTPNESFKTSWNKFNPFALWKVAKSGTNGLYEKMCMVPYLYSLAPDAAV